MFRWLSFVVGMLLVLALCGCGTLSGLIAPATATTPPSLERIFVASARSTDSLASVDAGRAETLSYTSYAVSIPGNHLPGNTPQQSSVKANPARNFTLAGNDSFSSGASFGNAVVSYAGKEYGAPAEAVVFVHGFNTSFVDGIYQLAQIGHDIRMPAAKVLYSWPSNDRMLNYIHDLDSVAFARDGLERLLDNLAASGVKRIVLVGYSMGAALVVETLRQMKLVGSERFFSRLGGVVLLSPDIDIDLFRIEAERMGGLPQPFVIYSAPSDPALRVVARYLTAEKPRLGALPDPRILAGLDLIYVDVANVPHFKQNGHLPVATSAPMIAAINELPRADLARYAEGAARGAVPGAAVTKFGKLTYVVLPATVQ